MKFNPNNLLLTDSYKQGHHLMYLYGLENISSYDESRTGALYPKTMYNGLQGILKNWFEGQFVTADAIAQAEQICEEHFMGVKNIKGESVFNKKMFQYILDKHDGMLPVEIEAVPEGSLIPVGHVQMQMRVTDEGIVAPLTNWMETVLTQVWFPCNVATIGATIRSHMQKAFNQTVDAENHWMIDYMLHDFGFRGTSSVESAMIGGAAHLVNFKGTDTMPALQYVQWAYNTKEMPGHSVLASEHSIKTSAGKDGESALIEQIVNNHPNGILSDVDDSFDIQEIVKWLCTDENIKKKIMARNGKYVVRPDSPRWKGDTAAAQIVWIAEQLAEGYGYTINKKGYKELDPHVGIIYGDGLSVQEILDAIDALVDAGFAASTCVYGMGGGLLQKHNRDTQRKAFKCNAQKINGTWIDIWKEANGKSSKRGQLKLIVGPDGQYQTTRLEMPGDNILRPVFRNGECINQMTHEEVVQRAREAIAA